MITKTALSRIFIAQISSAILAIAVTAIVMTGFFSLHV